MNFLKRLFPCVLVLVLACSAQTEKSVRTEGTEEQPKIAVDRGLRIAPGHCRMIGTVVSIDSTLEATGPCSKAPCRAVVRVDSILGYGSAFGNPIAVNGQIAVHFAFTLAPTTNDLFPNMTEHFPGLTVGARFQTDLESRMTMKQTGGAPSYLVYDYKRIE